MAGVDWNTGKPLDGFAHVAQSFAILMTTRKRSRVQRRHVGSDMPNLVDRAISQLTIIDFYAAIADAARFEPRFKIGRMSTSQGDDGRPTVAIQGDYYPRGHLGDFSVSEPKTMSIAL